MNAKILSLAFALTVIIPLQAYAAFTPPARLTFTFDDGTKNLYTHALPIFDQYDLPAVIYGETKHLTSGEDWVMTWAQLKEFRDQHGWEIGSHTVNHLDLTTLTDAQLEQELAGSKQTFAQNGITTTAFSSPFGAYNDKVVKAIAKHYTSHRGAWGGANTWPDNHNDFKLVSLEVKHNIPPEEVMGWIDEAIANNQWLVLLLHDVVEGTPVEYEYNKEDLRRIVEYAASKTIDVTTIAGAQALAKGPNLVSNSSFEEGSSFPTGWTRTNAQFITVDGNKNGSAPSPNRSIKMVGRPTEMALKSPLLPVENRDYLIKMFQNSQQYTSGGWALWVNEFDANNQWIGGQWLGGNYQHFIGSRYYGYTPTNENVKKIEMYLYLEANAKLTLYVDNIELRAVTDGTTPPPPPPPPPPTGNLISNGSFEDVSAGFATGWRAGTAQVTVDTNNKGSGAAPKNSIKIVGSSTLNTVISPLVQISDTAATYVLSFFQRMEGFQSGGVAVWLNEYDANGNWISGQWLGGTYQSAQSTKSMDYKPTSASVRSVEAYIYVEGQSVMTLYLDDVVFAKK